MSLLTTTQARHQQVSHQNGGSSRQGGLPQKNIFSKEMLFSVFNKEAVKATLSFHKRSIIPKHPKQAIAGAVFGAALGILTMATGPQTALHEYIGHGVLGFGLTNKYTEANRPSFYVSGFKHFNDMTNAHSFKEGAKAFVQWIIGDGSGWANSGRTESNALGLKMGPDAKSAWISLTGSLPGLLLDTLSVTGGMHLRKHSPFLGYALIGMGMMNHAMNSGYPIHAAVMSHSQMAQEAQQGHDFANFAVRMSNITGAPAQGIAIGSAIAWTAFVPLMGLVAYLHTKAHAEEIVPDSMALKHWLSKAIQDPKEAEKLQRLLDKHPRRDRLLAICEKILRTDLAALQADDFEDFEHQLFDFIDVLINHLPKKTLRKSKKEILKSWEKNCPKDRIQTALSVGSLVGNVTAVASKVFRIFADTIVPTLGPISTAFSYISPIFMVASLGSAGYELYKDLKASDTQIPKKAKMISIAKAVVSVACVALSIATLFAPGINIALIAGIALGCTINLVLSCARTSIIKHRFKILQSLQTPTWNFMSSLYKYQIEKNDKKRGNSLKKWISHVNEAQKYCLLSESQKNHLSRIRFSLPL